MFLHDEKPVLHVATCLLRGLHVAYLLRRMFFLDETVTRIHNLVCVLALVRLLPCMIHCLLSVPFPCPIGAHLSHVWFGFSVATSFSGASTTCSIMSLNYSSATTTHCGLLRNCSGATTTLCGPSLNYMLCLVKENGDSGSDDGPIQGRTKSELGILGMQLWMGWTASRRRSRNGRKATGR